MVQNGSYNEGNENGKRDWWEWAARGSTATLNLTLIQSSVNLLEKTALRDPQKKKKIETLALL